MDSAATIAAPGAALSASHLLDAGALPGAGILAYLTLPAPAGVLTPAPLRHVACGALVRLADATVWMLRTRGAPWSPDRLAVAARTLRDEHGAWRDGAYLTGRLSYALEIATVALVPPVLDRVDPALWDLRRTAIALVLRSLRTRGGEMDPAALAQATRATEAHLATALDAALAEFHAATDTEAYRQATPAAGDADIARYNFLVQAPHRAWRLQLARTFPLFVHAAATGGDNTAGETIRTAVDAGVPLVRHLAARWDVTAGAIRVLVGKDVTTVGGQWEGNVRGLVKVLDALRPDDRPGTRSADWQNFNRAVAAAERIFRAPPWTSAVARMWLREAARQGWARLDEAAAQRLWEPAAIAAVQQFRDSLARWLELAVARHATPPPVVPNAGCDAAADHYVSTRQPRRLAAIAERFEVCRRGVRADLVDQSSLLGGESFLPLLPGDMVAADGTRIVAPLTTRAALQRHGEAMDNCLEAMLLGSYVADCAAAKSFILGILDAATRKPASTAEVRVRRQPRAGRLEAHVVQHTAQFNAPPSLHCRQALAEAVAAVGSDAGQQHLEAGLRILRQRRLLGQARAKEEGECLLLGEALAQTLGPAALEELAAGVRKRLAAAG